MSQAEQKKLAEKQCIPCQGGVPPLPEEERQALLTQLQNWEIVENHHLHKSYNFPDFASALSWVNQIAAIAEEQAHHPDLEFGWGYVRVAIWTHKIDNLTEGDFILAAKLDQQFDAHSSKQ